MVGTYHDKQSFRHCQGSPSFPFLFSNVWVFFSVDVDNLLYVSSKPSAFPVLVKKSMEKKPPVTKTFYWIIIYAKTAFWLELWPAASTRSQSFCKGDVWLFSRCQESKFKLSPWLTVCQLKQRRSVGWKFIYLSRIFFIMAHTNLLKPNCLISIHVMPVMLILKLLHFH